MSLRVKLMLVFLTVCLIPLLATVFFAYRSASNDLAKQSLDQLQSVSQIQKNRTLAVVNLNLQRLSLVSARTSLLTDLDNYTRHPTAAVQAEMNAELTNALSTIINFQSISILNPQGETLSSTSPTLLGSNHAAELFFVRGLVRSSADIVFLGSDGKLLFQISGPLSLNGKTIGVINAVATADDLVAMAQDSTGLGNTGETLLAMRDLNGDALYIVPIRFDPQAALNRVVSKDALHTAITQALLKKEQGWTDLIDYRGVPVFASTQYIAETDWGLVVKQDATEALAPADNLRDLLLLITAIALCMVVAAAFYLARNISRPILNLSRVAREISAGNLSQRAQVTSKDETGVLGRAFNRMAEDLVNANTGLEQRVKERTQELERLAAERERLIIELEEKTKELEQIIYVSSHDLRSPLVNIQGYSQELAQSVKELRTALDAADTPPALKQRLSVILNEDIPDSMRYITVSSIKIDGLLDGLLRLSRLGRAALDIAEINMNQLMTEVAQNFEFRAKELGAVIHVDDLPPCLSDRVQINQVFSNLVDNALKFLAPSRPGNINISGKREGGVVIYCVEDNGIGIPPQYYEQIFEIFRRLNPKSGTGEGLGLTIVRRILERSSGKVWVESEPDKGSKFYVSLPAIK